jgi:hypothetical protein
MEKSTFYVDSKEFISLHREEVILEDEVGG